MNGQQLYSSIIIYDGGEMENHDFSNFTFSNDAIYMYKNNNQDYECGKYTKYINAIVMKCNDDKCGFPVTNKGNYKCKIMFNDKTEDEVRFIDFKTDTITNDLDSLNDNSKLFLYIDEYHCTFIPFSSVYQFAYKKEEDENYTVVRNYEINKKGDHKYGIYNRKLLYV